MMNSKEALNNIAVEFDEMGMICSNIVYKDFWEKDLHFKEIFGCEYEIIMKDLKRLEQLEKELKQTKLNFRNSQIHSKNCYKKLKEKFDRVKEVYHRNYELIQENEKLKQENQKLIVNKNVAQGIAKKQKVENDKTKEAIKILESKFKFELGVSVVKERYCYSLEFLFNNSYFRITKEEYELLKSVLEEE